MNPAMAVSSTTQRETQGSKVSTELPAYLPWLDVLRFIACFLVIVQHSVEKVDIGPLGHIGVAMFFSISGFLIGRILAAGGSLPTFYARRFLRIYPAYAFTLALFGATVYLPFLHHPEFAHLFWHNIVYYLTFTFRLSPDTASLPLVIVWSLCVEELFYLLLPLLFLLRDHRYIAGALAAVVAVLLVPRLSLLPDGSGTWFLFPLNLFVGVLLALSRPKLRSGYPFIALAAVTVMVLNGVMGWFHNFGLISAVLCTAAVWSLAACPMRLPKVLEPFRRMGMVSYGIYLLHFFCVPVALRLCVQLSGHPALMYVCVILITTGLSVCVAAAMKRYIEDPPLKLRPMLKSHPRLLYALAAIQFSLIPSGLLYAVLVRRFHL